MSTKHEPPFGGTAACPMCPSEFRNLHAVAFNMHLRFTGQSMSRDGSIQDLKDAVKLAEDSERWLIAGPEVQRLRNAARAFGETLHRSDLDEMAAAVKATQPLVDAHFADRLHSHGGARHVAPATAPQPEPILQFFAYEHLPVHLQLVSKPFCELAHAIVFGDNVPTTGTVTMGPPLPRNAERSVALRKLLEAKDAAVRALIAK